MKKSLMLVIIVALLCGVAFADSGVVLDAKGTVKITQDGKTQAAKTGAQFKDGATIDVAKGSAATLMFSNGSTKKLAGGEKYTATKSGTASKNKPLIKGIAMAYNDATATSSGPTVHGMVKAAGPGKNTEPSGDQTLTAERQQKMKVDLETVDKMELEKDGKSLMNAQIYYKYGQYNKMVEELLPVYKTQKPPADLVKNMLALGYEKLGKPEKAKKYK